MNIYKKALGKDFEKLHPELQRRFGIALEDNTGFRGTGVMEKIYHGPFFTVPTLAMGIPEHLLFPETGRNIPFTIENYTFMDTLGREAVSWIRKFHFSKKVRHFDATMVHSEKRKGIIDYLGTHQRLGVDLEISVTENGGMRIRAGRQRLYGRSMTLNLPKAFSALAEIEESFNSASGLFEIEVKVKNFFCGDFFGYKGSFKAEYFPVKPEEIPAYARPLRNEIRE
jgi:hypothetical protein